MLNVHVSWSSYSIQLGDVWILFLIAFPSQYLAQNMYCIWSTKGCVWNHSGHNKLHDDSSHYFGCRSVGKYLFQSWSQCSMCVLFFQLFIPWAFGGMDIHKKWIIPPTRSHNWSPCLRRTCLKKSNTSHDYFDLCLCLHLSSSKLFMLGCKKHWMKWTYITWTCYICFPGSHSTV